jgi:hypothetical protein
MPPPDRFAGRDMHREDTRTAADADTFARLREALEQQAAKDDIAGNRPLANRRSAGFQHDLEACGTHMQSPFLPRVPVRRRFAQTASGFSRRPLSIQWTASSQSPLEMGGSRRMAPWESSMARSGWRHVDMRGQTPVAPAPSHSRTVHTSRRSNLSCNLDREAPVFLRS